MINSATTCRAVVQAFSRGFRIVSWLKIRIRYGFGRRRFAPSCAACGRVPWGGVACIVFPRPSSLKGAPGVASAIADGLRPPLTLEPLRGKRRR